jgi:hypothetical protein
MLREMTRSRLIQVWFAAVSLVAIAGVTLGANMTAGTAFLLFALSLVPPAIVLVLWPVVQPTTAADVLYGEPESVSSRDTSRPARDVRGRGTP